MHPLKIIPLYYSRLLISCINPNITILTSQNSLSCLPANLANRRKLHRHHCSHRRCMPLHSRVPFP
uniref:Uncharacterized protein n=1 Tax=Pseudonaja textilis TaxID=8673 RepID=A0A670XN85_PSETE